MAGLAAIFPMNAKYAGRCLRSHNPISAGTRVIFADPKEKGIGGSGWRIIGCADPSCSMNVEDAKRWWAQQTSQRSGEGQAQAAPVPPAPTFQTPPPVSLTPNGPIEIATQPARFYKAEGNVDENYAKLMGKLRSDPYQRALVEVQPTPGVVRALAGAGAGKTSAIVGLVSRWLREELVDPSRLVVTTFTNKGGSELMKRLAQVLPQRIVARLTGVGTYHSLAGRTIKNVVPASHDWHGARNVDGSGSGAYKRASEVMAGATYWKLALGEDYIRDLGRAGIGLDKEQVNPRDYRLAVDVLRANKVNHDSPGAERACAVYPLQGLYDAWGLYEAQKRAARAWDFADSLAAFEALVAKQPGGFTTIVDEAQDNSILQIDLSKALAYGKLLMMVGDSRQAIFSWRGAEPEYFGTPEKFAKDVRGGAVEVRSLPLAKNYRSGTKIVALGNDIARGQSWAAGVDAVAHRSEPGVVMIEAGGAEAIVAMVKGAEAEGKFKPSDCAVLCRVNADQGPVEAACLAAHVPVQVVGGPSFFNSKDWTFFESWLFFAMTRGAAKPPYDENGELRSDEDNEAIVQLVRRALGQLNGLGLYTVKDVTTSVLAGQSLQEALLSKAADGRTKTVQREALQGAAKALNRMFDSEGRLHVVIDNVVSELRKLLGLTEQEAEAEPEADAESDMGASLAQAAIIAKHHDTLGSLHLFAERCRGNAQAVDEEKGEADGPLVISTIHKAKGREWPTVFVVATQGVFPHAKATGKRLEEEQRLFYVAVTRAADLLVLTYNESEDGKRGGPSGYLDFAEPYLQSRDVLPKGKDGSKDPDDKPVPALTVEDLQAGGAGDEEDEEPTDEPEPLQPIAPAEPAGSFKVRQPKEGAASRDSTPTRRQVAERMLAALDDQANDRASKSGSDRKTGPRAVEVTLLKILEVLRPLRDVAGTVTRGERAGQVTLTVPVGSGKGSLTVWTGIPPGDDTGRGVGEDSMKVTVAGFGEGQASFPFMARTKNWRVNLGDRIAEALRQFN